MRNMRAGLFLTTGVLVAGLIVGCGREPKEQEVSVIDENHFDQLAGSPDAAGNAAGGVEVMGGDVLPPAPGSQAALPAGELAPITADPSAAVPQAAAPQQPAQQLTVKATASYEEKVQTALKNAGYYTGSIDGKIGAKTREAIKSFQTANGLKADGVVGPSTWERLKKYAETR